MLTRPQCYAVDGILAPPLSSHHLHSDTSLPTSVFILSEALPYTILAINMGWAWVPAPTYFCSVVNLKDVTPLFVRKTAEKETDAIKC